MTKLKTQIRIGKKVASFPIGKARSVHLMKHALLSLIPSLQSKTKDKVRGVIIRNSKIIFSV